jgi:hypothetical protein
MGKFFLHRAYSLRDGISMSLTDEEECGLLSTSASLHQQLLAIVKHDIYAPLFSELAVTGTSLQEFLLRHPDDLFPKLDPENAVIPEEYSISIPLFFWESPQRMGKPIRGRPSILELEGGEEPSANGNQAVEAPSEDGSPVDFSAEELILLNALRVIQHNPHLLHLAQEEEEVTLQQVRKALGRQGVDLKPVRDEVLTLIGNAAEQEGFGAIFHTFLRRSDTETESTYEIKKMINEVYRYLQDFVVDVPRLLGELHRLLPEVAQKGAPFLRRHNAFVHWVYGTSSSKTLQALDVLWELGMLYPMVIILECRTCTDNEGRPIRQVLSSDIPPQSLKPRPVCGWCGKPYLVEAFYGLDGFVSRWIFSQDRLLSYVVGYLLETQQMSWRSHIYTTVSEHDFHVSTAGGNHLIECKVFRCSGPIGKDLGLQRKVRHAISQLVSHSNEIQALSATLVCHPCPFPKKTLDKWAAEELKKNRLHEPIRAVQTMGIDRLPKFLKRLTQCSGA